MPYVETESTIKTKVIGVASKIDDQDKMKVRQIVLKRMNEDPDSVSLIFLRQRQVWVSFDDGQEFHLGDLKAKYQELIMKNVTQVVEWTVTGGYPIPTQTLVLAGHPTMKVGGHKANFGLNIYIKLI